MNTILSSEDPFDLGPVQDWHERARCRDEDPELFVNPTMADRALALCAQCTVVEVCLQAINDHEAAEGPIQIIQGGTTMEQRQGILET